MVTAMTDVGSRVAGFDAGADDYIPKPFEARELGARLRAHIGLARQRSQIASLEGVLNTIRMLTHDLNNPLQTVVGGLHFFCDAPGSAANRDEGLQMVRDGVSAMTDLAHRLADISDAVFKASPIGPMLDVEASTRSARASGAATGK